MFCPKCETAYREGFRKCSDCNEDLVLNLPERNEDEHPDGKIITIFTSSNVHEANLVRGLLEAHDIQTFIFDENISRLNPFYTNAVGGIKIGVEQRQEKDAEDVLTEYRTHEGQDPHSGHINPLGRIGEEDAPVKQEKTRSCPRCHKEPDHDSNFCSDCGELVPWKSGEVHEDKLSSVGKRIEEKIVSSLVKPDQDDSFAEYKNPIDTDRRFCSRCKLKGDPGADTCSQCGNKI